jgi:ketosteroid isomerase-like protein
MTSLSASGCAAAALSAISIPAGSPAQVESDRAAVAALDLSYQAAVKRNDAETMDRILHPQFALILGDGRVVSRDEILEEAREGSLVFEKQDEEPGTQAVRLWGDTAVVTALLWVKGTAFGKPFDRRRWFSDTYVRTQNRWLYAFAQASLPLPKN